jgi:cytidine deaminase
MIAVCCENYTDHTNTLCGEDVAVCELVLNGAYINTLL